MTTENSKLPDWDRESITPIKNLAVGRNVFMIETGDGTKIYLSRAIFDRMVRFSKNSAYTTLNVENSDCGCGPTSWKPKKQEEGNDN